MGDTKDTGKLQAMMDPGTEENVGRRNGEIKIVDSVIPMLNS